MSERHTPGSFIWLVQRNDEAEIYKAFDAIYADRAALLEALQAIVAELMEGDDLSATQIARHAGRAAIAKATGEQS